MKFVKLLMSCFNITVRKPAQYLTLILILVLSVSCTTTVARKGVEHYFPDPNVVSLIKAAENGNEAAIKSLVDAGANINSVSKDGFTPLIWTFLSHNNAGVTALLKNGADPNLVTLEDDSALTLAAGSKDLKTLEILLKFGGDPNAYGQRGDTALLLAIHRRRWDHMRALLKHGADINKMDIHNNNTPAMAAAGMGQYEQVYYMLENGADHTIVDRYKYTLAHMLNLPVGDASPWKKKVQTILEGHGITFPVPRPK